MGRPPREAQDYFDTTLTWTLPKFRLTWSDILSSWRWTVRSTDELPSFTLDSVTSSRNAGRRGLHKRISSFAGSNSSPSDACSMRKGAPLAQACGEQATG